MPTNAKCVFWNQNNNLSDKPIVLNIRKYDDRTTEITVNYASHNAFYRKIILLVIIIVMNLISLVYNIANPNYVAVILLVVLVVTYNMIFSVKQEKVIVVEPLGYQIEVHYAVGQLTRYVAWEHVKSIFINEVVSKQRVIFILAMLTKDSDKDASAIIPLFTETMPRLSCLETIYQYIEKCH